VVDEITDQYLRNEIQGAERARVEKHFLRSAERQEKLSFARELLHQVEVESATAATVQTRMAPAPSLLDHLRAFYRRGMSPVRAAAVGAAVVAVVLLFYFAWPPDRSSRMYASLNLTISSSNRADAVAAARVKLERGNAGIQIHLTVPDEAPAAKTYHARLIDEEGVETEFEVTKESDGKLMVTVPAPIKRGTYTIQLFAEKADGTQERVRGSYLFTVE
jgi:methionine-rich copper-binding protein CopC